MKTSSRFLQALVFVVAAGTAPLGQCQNPTNAGEQPRTIAYRITPTDKISIVVIGESDLNVAGKRVDAGGNISLALLTTPIHVAGLTASEAQATIERAYIDGRILRAPQVSINIEEYAPREVSISGPGIKQNAKFSLPPETIMTLKDLILKAGGFTDTAKGEAVTVTRMMPDGKLKTQTFDVANLLKGRPQKSAHPEDANFALESGDIVWVPEKII